MAEIDQLPETPPGVPTGVSVGGVRGGSLPNSRWDGGDRGGRAVHLAINHLVAPRSQEVQRRAARATGFNSGRGRGYIAAAMPTVLRFIEPCLPSPADRPPSGTNWIS